MLFFFTFQTTKLYNLQRSGIYIPFALNGIAYFFYSYILYMYYNFILYFIFEFRINDQSLGFCIGFEFSDSGLGFSIQYLGVGLGKGRGCVQCFGDIRRGLVESVNGIVFYIWVFYNLQCSCISIPFTLNEIAYFFYSHILYMYYNFILYFIFGFRVNDQSLRFKIEFEFSDLSLGFSIQGLKVRVSN